MELLQTAKQVPHGISILGHSTCLLCMPFYESTGTYSTPRRGKFRRRMEHKHSLGKLWVIMGVAGLKSRLQGNNYKGAGVLVETDPMQVVVALRKLHLQPRAWSRICGPYIMKTRQTTQNSYLL